VRVWTVEFRVLEGALSFLFSFFFLPLLVADREMRRRKEEAGTPEGQGLSLVKALGGGGSRV
jgi:hypothetical protein